MILVDSGPLVAMFDRRDREHRNVLDRFKRLSGPLVTTIPNLTEAAHLLGSGSTEIDALTDFIRRGACFMHIPDAPEIDRAFELKAEYADLPMDFADGSLIAAAETHNTVKIFTLDRRDFSVYRILRGRRRVPVEIV
jgi:hypothetical protein